MASIVDIPATKKLLMTIWSILLLLLFVNTSILSPYCSDLLSQYEIEEMMEGEGSEKDTEDESEEETEFIEDEYIFSKFARSHVELILRNQSLEEDSLFVASPPPELS